MPLHNKNYLLLDSCVIEYLLNNYTHDAVTDQLKKWSKGIFELAISQISYTELIDGAKPEKETKVISLLNNFYSFPVVIRTVKGAGILGSLYKEESESLKDISLVDKLIAMTSAIYNVPIITANIRDFPTPFFQTITSENIIYEKNNKKLMINIGVMKANYSYISNKFNNRK